MELTDTRNDKAVSSRFWYGASIAEFLGAADEAVLGELARNCDFALIPTQRDAWLAQIEFLRSKLIGLAGSVFFEFNIPRMGRRIDVVLVIGPVVFAIEFKVGEKTFDRSAIDQVWDYGLDLKNFHEASHDVSIVPILIATEARSVRPSSSVPIADKLNRPIIVDPANFRGAVELALATDRTVARSIRRFGLAPRIIRRRRSSKLPALFMRSIPLKQSRASTLARRICTSPPGASRNWLMKRKPKAEKISALSLVFPGREKLWSA